MSGGTTAWQPPPRQRRATLRPGLWLGRVSLMQHLHQPGTHGAGCPCWGQSLARGRGWERLWGLDRGGPVSVRRAWRALGGQEGEGGWGGLRGQRALALTQPLRLPGRERRAVALCAPTGLHNVLPRFRRGVLGGPCSLCGAWCPVWPRGHWGPWERGRHGVLAICGTGGTAASREGGTQSPACPPSEHPGGGHDRRQGALSLVGRDRLICGRTGGAVRVGRPYAYRWA